MPTPGKLELTILINEFPADVQTVETGLKQFDILAGEQIVTVSLKPKVFKKLEQAQENYPQWASAIALTNEGQDRFRCPQGAKRADLREKVKRAERRGSTCC